MTNNFQNDSDLEKWSESVSECRDINNMNIPCAEMAKYTLVLAAHVIDHQHHEVVNNIPT